MLFRSYEPAYSTADVMRGILARDSTDGKRRRAGEMLAGQWDDDPTGQKARDRAALDAAFDKPTIAGKLLAFPPISAGLRALGLDEEGTGTGPESDRFKVGWTDALHSTMWTPYRLAHGLYDAAMAPGRALEGEFGDPQDPANRQRYISEGLNVAGNMAMSGAAVPKPTNAAGMFGGRLAKAVDREMTALPQYQRPFSEIGRAHV